MARVLIVEDCVPQRELYAELLATCGHQVVSAGNGRDAAGKLRQGGFDLVVTDIFMPDCDGVELIRTVRRERPHLPVLAVSGGGEAGTGIVYLPLAQKLGATAVMTKSAPLHAFLAIVSELLVSDHRAAA